MQGGISWRKITVVGSKCWIVMASCTTGLKAKNGRYCQMRSAVQGRLRKFALRKVHHIGGRGRTSEVGQLLALSFAAGIAGHQTQLDIQEPGGQRAARP